MSEMSNVRRRIRNRRNGKETAAPLLFRVFYKIIMIAMAIGVLGLAYLVNTKIGVVKLPSQWVDIGFAKISEWLPFDAWFQNAQEEEMVTSLPAYSLIEGNKYANGTNQANLILDGVVLHVEEKEEAKSSVTVRHDNGVIVTYGHLNQIQVKQDERLKKGDIIGSYLEYVTLDMVKNQESIDLNTALLP